MLTPIETKPVYNWNDIENELLKIINKDGEKITSSDIWDYWSDQEEICNDTTKTFWFSFDEYDIINYKRQNQETLCVGLQELQKQLGNPDSILIHYSW